MTHGRAYRKGLVWFALAIGAGCGNGTGGGGTTGGGSTSQGMDSGSSGSSPGSAASSSSTDTSASAVDSSSGTGDMTTTDTGDTPPLAMCTTQGCITECTLVAELTDDQGDACTCTYAADLPTSFDCMLPEPCGSVEGGPYSNLCVLQAMRWGVVGRYDASFFVEDQGGDSVTVAVLDDGRIVATKQRNTEHDCCGGTVASGWSRSYGIASIPAHDDAVWGTCLSEFDAGYQNTLPSCVDPDVIVGLPCEPEPPMRCPEVVPTEGACDVTCPMASDGVCDESIGTGLCVDGCDPVDCACPGDVPGSCDDVLQGGPCPIGSDPDCG